MPKSQDGKKFVFKYVVPEEVRDLYVNGAWGGITPRNEIHMHLFSERNAIPDKVTHKINQDSTLSKDSEVESGSDFVRLIQTSVVFDLITAISIRNWLNDKILFLEGLKEKKNEKKGSTQ